MSALDNGDATKEEETMIDTSIEAYERLPEFIGGHEDKIMNFLRHFRHGGITHMIAKELDMQEIQVNRRMSKLERDGKVYRPGLKKITPSGRKAYVWVLTNKYSEWRI